MRRREFFAALGGAAAWPVVARAQQPGKVRRIGILLFNSPQTDPISPLLQGLQTLGYVDGKRNRLPVCGRQGRAASQFGSGVGAAQTGRDFRVWRRRGAAREKRNWVDSNRSDG